MVERSMAFRRVGFFLWPGANVMAESDSSMAREIARAASEFPVLNHRAATAEDGRAQTMHLSAFVSAVIAIHVLSGGGDRMDLVGSKTAAISRLAR